MTTDDRRLRFFGAGPNLSHGFLARLTQIDYAREMAFVAIGKGTNALLGVVRVIADPDYTRGEYAILVRSDLKGRGLGWQLMQHLIAYAKAEQLQELHGAVLAGNTTMLQMCRQLGFAIEAEPGDSDDPPRRARFASEVATQMRAMAATQARHAVARLHRCRSGARLRPGAGKDRCLRRVSDRSARGRWRSHRAEAADHTRP